MGGLERGPSNWGADVVTAVYRVRASQEIPSPKGSQEQTHAAQEGNKKNPIVTGSGIGTNDG